MKKIFWVAIMIIAFAVPAYADVVNFNAGTTYQTTALTGYSTDGAMMDGMKVTATFADGIVESLYWVDTGANSGGVLSSSYGWSLTEVGDTFDGSGTWTLSNSRTYGLISVAIDAGLGDSVFDTWNPDGDVEGSDGSARGWNFARTSSNNFSVTANYYDYVAITGYQPYGDLFRNLVLSIDSGGLIGTTGAIGMMTFQQDTDNLRISGDITPTPEPVTMILLGLGLAGLAGVRRKIQK